MNISRKLIFCYQVMLVLLVLNIVLFMFGAGHVVFGIVTCVGWLVSKGINDAMNRQVEGTEIFGRGNFDYRIEVQTEDTL